MHKAVTTLTQKTIQLIRMHALFIQNSPTLGPKSPLKQLQGGDGNVASRALFLDNFSLNLTPRHLPCHPIADKEVTIHE